MTGSDDSLTACSPQRHEQKFEATGDQVREARRFLAGVLNGCPAADDVLLVASELVTNCVRHSASSEPGGTFTLVAEISEGDHVRIEARDDGGPWHHSAPAPVLPDAEFGRGLAIVAALAADHGVTGDPSVGWVAWAILPWHPVPFPESTSPNGHPDDHH